MLMHFWRQYRKGVFLAPAVIEDEVRRMYGVQVVGREDNLRERFYAISVEKRLAHPAVVAITQAARLSLADRQR